MVEIFGIKLFECSECNKTKRQSRKRKRSYKGGYTYKHTGSNDEGEDVSNSRSVSKSNSRSVSKGSRSSNDRGRGTRNKRRRRH